MKAYHVTNELYNIGDEISIPKGEKSRYYINGTVEQRDTNDFFDNFIDRNHPDFVHRRSALFAFEDLKAAKEYCRAEGAQHIYEVDFTLSYRGPFVLVNTLMKNLAIPKKCEIIAKEYFSPNLSILNGQEWYTYELIGSFFKVLQEIQERNTIGIGFQPDYEKAEILFGNSEKGTSGILA